MLKSILICTSLLVMTSVAQARDVSAQQVGLEYARGNLEKAEKLHKANLQQVVDAEKRLIDAQKRLEESRQKAQASKQALDEANVKHVKAQELLDKAWKE